MPKREVTSAPWAPVPARACTGKAPRARQHRAVGRLSTAPAPAEATCRGDLPAFRSDRRDPIPCSTCRPRRAHRAPRPLRQPARPGCRRADACVGRKVRGARADRGACGAGSDWAPRMAERIAPVKRASPRARRPSAASPSRAPVGAPPPPRLGLQPLLQQAAPAAPARRPCPSRSRRPVGAPCTLKMLGLGLG